MSKQDRKEQHKAVRIISYIALIVGIATFLCVLLIVPATGLYVINRKAFISERFDWLTNIAWYSSQLFKYITIPAIILSIVTFLIERNKYYQLLPLAFVTIGELLYFVCRAIILSRDV
jgi:L-cystine uptake protein TcyP (sodium:dicarboxylate symporter family)